MKDSKNADSAMSEDSQLGLNEERRTFVRRFATGATAAALIPAAIAEQSATDDAGNSRQWDEEYDIVVVGGGAAGCSAAVKAHDLGSSAIVLEKGPVLGGTSAKAVGGFWIPNNPAMRKAGIKDERADCLKYMVRLSCSDRYDPRAAPYGAEPEQFALMETYYDNASRVVDELREFNAVNLISFDDPIHGPVPDYYGHLPENKAPLGRSMVPAKADGSFGNGASMMRQFREALARKGIAVRVRHRAVDLIRNAGGRVIGVVVSNKKGVVTRIKARQGVIFASGGFSHNEQMRTDYLKGIVFGSCASPNSEGDFVDIGTRVGAKLGNMNNAWWCQVPLEVVLSNPSVPSGVWTSPGDSMIQVNRAGKRIVDEKFVYNERTQVHFGWDAVKGIYQNMLTFLIYDQRTAVNFAGFNPIPPEGSAASHVITAPTIEALASAIEERLSTLAPSIGAFSLEPGFKDELESSVNRFNQFAEAGVDEDFSRGSQHIDRWLHFFGGPYQPKATDKPNPTMHPISDQGPYYAVIMAAGTLDTKGGPKINRHAQVTDTRGQPIEGLYGAGNCIASPTGPAYWSGGCTLGAAITFGNIAAAHAISTALSRTS